MINKKYFTQLKLLDTFSTMSNKYYCVDNSKVKADDILVF